MSPSDDRFPDVPDEADAPDKGARPPAGSALPALTELRRWMRAHPYGVDALLALGVFVAILAGTAAEFSPAREPGPSLGSRGVSPATAALAALACSVLVLRRRAPMPVLCVTGVVTVVGLVVDPHPGVYPEGHRAPIVMAAIIALYTVTNRTDRVTAVRVGVVTAVVLTAAGMLLGSRPWYAQENLATFAWTGLAAAAGEAVRNRRAFVDAMRERAERAERTREEEARRRVAEERMRIARELHDVVAHHIALVNVQAGVASHVMDQRPDQAKEALAHVREASRHALNELQATVGLLRQSDESVAPTEPAPGLAVLDELVDGFTRTGLSVSVDVVGEPGGARTDAAEGASAEGTGTQGTATQGTAAEVPEGDLRLPSAVDLTAYRVVQEALTNVQKHVGRGAHAEVRIVTRPDAVEITVTDDGEGAGDCTAASAQPSGSARRAGLSGTGANGPGVPGAEPASGGTGAARAAASPSGAATGTAAASAPASSPLPAARTAAPPVAPNGTRSAAPRERDERQGGGHGLMGMRERAAALHGECETGPLPEGGFRVRVRLPLPHGPARTGPAAPSAEAPQTWPAAGGKTAEPAETGRPPQSREGGAA